MARPRKYDTPEKLDKAIADYFAYMETTDQAPTWANMLLYLNISQSTVLRYQEDKGDYKGFGDPIKKAELMHCDYWQQLALKKPNMAVFCMFELKQPHNGGFRDKPKDDPTHTVSLDIKISGCDGFDPGA